jgi:hypothetical protein
MGTTGGASSGSGTRRRRVEPRGASRGGVCLGAEARSALSEQATWAGAARTKLKASG